MGEQLQSRCKGMSRRVCPLQSSLCHVVGHTAELNYITLKFMACQTQTLPAARNSSANRRICELEVTQLAHHTHSKPAEKLKGRQKWKQEQTRANRN